MKITKAYLKQVIKEELSSIKEMDVGYMDGPLSAYEDEDNLDPVTLADELVTLAVKQRMASASDEGYYGDMGLQEMARAQISVENWSSKNEEDRDEEDLYWLRFCYEELDGHPAFRKLKGFGAPPPAVPRRNY